MANKRHRRKLAFTSWWKSRLIVAAVTLACVNSQDLSACCDKAAGGCKSVCEKMSLVDLASESTMREERIQHIYKFCTPHLIEFWICMNQTIQEVVSGSEWWGRACCGLGRSTTCRHACAKAGNESALVDACRRSDEIAFFDCVRKQQEAQWCCSQTQSIKCHEACRNVLWRIGQSAPVESRLKERAAEACDQSPELSRCLRDLTASTVHADTSKYLPCCHASTNQECRATCESVLRRTGDSQEISAALISECGEPTLHDGFWQCFLKTDTPAEAKDVIPYDVAKLHCCQKATTINCRRLCFNTFNNEWHDNWQKFYSECLGDPQETDLTQCVEEVDTPCSLGCAGLTYCSQLNNRPTTLFRSCSAHADLDAHLAVAEQKNSGSVTVSGLELPLKNSSQCTSDVWKSVACALHVKPCTARGHSSLLCEEDCMRLVSSCVEWSRAPNFTAQSLCARLTPRSPAAPCVPLRQFMAPSTELPFLSASEAVTSPCSGSPCNATQVCVVNRNCLLGDSCARFTCVDGCPLGDGSGYIVAIGTWTRVPMSSPAQKSCFKLCRCSSRGLAHCQPLPCVSLDNCLLHDKVVAHREKYYMECNPCACVLGERVCGRRACGRAALLTGLPCNCPPHHLPAHTPRRLYPNACLAKCAGASDAEIEFGSRAACAAASCPRRHACLPAPNVCLSRLQTSCPQHVCVNTTSCNSQPAMAVCDTDGRTHANPCHLVMSGRRFAYWGQCLQRCSNTGTVCGVNGVTYFSECAAWAEYVSVDYLGVCLAVGPISDLMEPKCQVDRILCPELKKPRCLGFTAPGACCPKCGGALRILYSKKQIDRALYGTNISATVVNLSNLMRALERHVKIAECVLRGFLTIEMEIFVTVESVLQHPTDLQLNVCVLEAEKLADLINRESALISSDLGLSALSYAITVHTYPISSASTMSISVLLVLIASLSVYILR